MTDIQVREGLILEEASNLEQTAQGLMELIDPDPLHKSISLGHIANWITTKESNLRRLIKISINEKSPTMVADEM